MREKNIKNQIGLLIGEKKTLGVSVLVIAPDSGVAVIVRLVREVVFLVVIIPRMHIKNSRGGQDGLGRRWSGWCECE